MIIILNTIIITLLIVIIFQRKVINSLEQRTLIKQAILKYRMETHNTDIWHTDVESFGKTLWRLWDWGYTRILPKEKFELIKPYIKK